MLQRILLSVMLSALLLGGTELAGYAADWGRIMTPQQPLNVRQGRGPTTKRITTIMPGRRVRADFSQDGWIAVFDLNVEKRDPNQALGYVKASYLVPAGEWGELCTPRGMLNIRQARTPRSEHVRTLQPGDVVKVDFEKDGWVAVFRPDEQTRREQRAIGYSNAKFLFPATQEQVDRALGKAPAKASSAKAAEPEIAASGKPVAGYSIDDGEADDSEPDQKTDVQSAPAQASHWGRLVKLSRRVNLRAGRTAASKLVDTLTPGQAVRVALLHKGWYAAFPLGENRRDEAHALGYIYAPLIQEDLGGLPEAVPAERSGARMEPAAGELEEPMNRVRGTVSSQPPAELQSSPETVEPSTSSQEVEGPQTMVIQPPESAEPHKGPMPVADQTRHGFHYKVMDRLESRQGRYPLDVLRVFLDIAVIPQDNSLSDFCSTLWEEQWRQGTLMRVDVYLPGMDLKDLSYAEALFDGKGMRQFWTREAVLYGTRFKR